MALLANQIWQCLDLDLLEGAEVLAEQLVANDASADTCHLLAYVQYRRGRLLSAKASAAGHLQHLGCVWVFAQSCLRLEQAPEGLAALDAVRSLWALDNDLPLPVGLGRGELSPAAFHLQYAQLQALTDADAALDEFTASTRLNPYLVENVLPLCLSAKLKVKTARLFARFEDPFAGAADASAVAAPAHLPLSGGGGGGGLSLAEEPAVLLPPQTVTSTPRARLETPRRNLSTPARGANAAPSPFLSRQPNNAASSFINTQSGSWHTNHNLPMQQPQQQQPQQQPHSSNFNAGHNMLHLNAASLSAGASAAGAPPAAAAPALGLGSGANQHANLGGIFQTPTQTQQAPLPGHINRRQQDRILSLSFKHHDQASLSSLGKGIFTSPQQQQQQQQQQQIGKIVGLKTGVEALECIAEAVELLSEAKFSDAVAQLRALSKPIRRAPFVLQLAGRLQLELGAFAESARLYTELHAAQPDRAEGMEYLSTALWHLKRESNLSLLGHELTRRGSSLRRQWQSWCALGNAFSLEHDTQNAMKCFQRATTINPRSAYAHTLMGYECIANDELENATNAFSRAICANPQHYNAWYGLGSVHLSLGQNTAAELYFLQAIRLNPSNAVLLCFLGSALEARGKFGPAIAQYERACQLSPASPMPRFRKAEALLEAEMYEEALKELLEVEKAAPEDPSVHFAIARAHKGLEEGELAVQRFTIAQQLSPKMAVLIRRELETL